MKKFIFLMLFQIPIIILSQVIHIPNDYATIQQGINEATDGDTVLVDPGLYYENINFKGKAITVASQYLINPDSIYINNTIINGSQPNHPDSASVVMFLSGEDTTSVLCGFTITEGTGLKTYGRYGGGISGVESGAKITNNIIIDNSLNSEGANGGGISFFGGTINDWIIITDNTIKSNEVSVSSGASGGGIFTTINNRIERNIIENNTCTSISGGVYGGGIGFIDMQTEGFQLIIKNNVIKGNVLDGENAYGGGILYGSGYTASKGPHEIQHYSPTLKTQIIENIISNNTVIAVSQWYGSGIFIQSSVYDIDIISNEISYNTGSDIQNSYGGGLLLRGAGYKRVLIKANIVKENQSNNGGGFHIQSVYNLYIINNLFDTNEGSNGGAIYLLEDYKKEEAFSEVFFPFYEINSNKNRTAKRDYKPVLANNTFVNNNAEVGGAMLVENNQVIPIVYNSIFWNNTTPSGNGKDMSSDTSSHVILYNNDIDTTSIEGNWTGDGNIFDNPKFIGVGDHPYQIDYYSPCIDAGTLDTTGLNLPEYDLAGEIRIFNERVDIGAYEWNTTVGIEESSMPEPSQLRVNAYPNPFCTSTTIEYHLNQPSDITLTIFNHLGKQVELIRQYQQQGKQQVIWNAVGLPAGMYFFTLKAGEQVAIGKIVLVR